MRQTLPIRFRQIASSEPLTIHRRLGTEHPLGELLPRHLETENEDRLSFIGPPTCSAMFSASAVFPIDGRAAMTISSDGCSPPDSILSTSVNPVERPVIAPPFVV